MPRTPGSVSISASTAASAALRLLGRIGDQRRQQRRRAKAAMRGGDGANSVRRRLVVEQHIAAAIDLHVDEAGREPGAVRQGAHAASWPASSPRGTTAAMRGPSMMTAASRPRRSCRRTHSLPRRRAGSAALIACVSPSADGGAGRHRCRAGRQCAPPAHRSSVSGKRRRRPDDRAQRRQRCRQRSS